jgi:hypothetical protein
VTSLAAKSYNNADVIEVQTNTIRGIDVLVNGELVDFEASISNTLSVIWLTVLFETKLSTKLNK